MPDDLEASGRGTELLATTASRAVSSSVKFPVGASRTSAITSAACAATSPAGSSFAPCSVKSARSTLRRPLRTGFVPDRSDEVVRCASTRGPHDVARRDPVVESRNILMNGEIEDQLGRLWHLSQ